MNMYNEATASAREVQPPEKPEEFKTEVTQWNNQVVQGKKNKQQQKCQAQDNIICSGKKNQETKFVWPVKPPVHMWSVTKSSVSVRKQVHSNKSKVILQEDDQNCQENINRRPMQSQVNDDKKSQADRNCQTSVMWPMKPEKEIQLPTPAVPFEYKRSN